MIISLENAKKLYEVAKKYVVELPESKWVWYKHPLRKWVKRFGNIITNENLGDEYIPAYTTDELLEWLPAYLEKETEGFVIDEEIIKQKKSFNLNIRKTEPYFYCFYSRVSGEGEEFMVEEEAETPADALCKLATKLIEEGVIK